MTIPTTENRIYSINGITIKVSSNSAKRLASINSYLSLPPGQPGFNHGNLISLTHLELKEEELHSMLPLPGVESLDYEGILLVDRKVPYRIYGEEGRRLADYEGFGRSQSIKENNYAQSVLLANSGISPVYADILFAYNPLLGLLNTFGYEAVHASCVQINGKGVIFTGKSGSGKSTAAYAMLRRGHPLLADDRILVKKGNPYKALAISDVVKISHEGRHRFFPELIGLEPLHTVEDELYYKITEMENYSYLNQTGLDYLIYFERVNSPESSLEEVNPARAVGSLFPVTMSNYNPVTMENKFNFLMDFLNNIKCYRVSFGIDMDDFAFKIAGLVS